MASNGGVRIRGETVVLQIARVEPNSYNWNRLPPDHFSALKSSLLKHGQVRAVLVSKNGHGFILVNGEHTYRAMKELGASRILAQNLGVLSNAEARRIAIATQEIGGDPDEAQLEAAIAVVGRDLGVDDLTDLPFHREEIADILDRRTPESVDDAMASEVGESPGGGESKQKWSTLTFRIADELRPLVEKTLKKLTDNVQFKHTVPEDVRRGLALEKLCAEYEAGR